MPRYAVKLRQPAICIEDEETICDTLKNLSPLSGQSDRLPPLATQFAAEPTQDDAYSNKSRQFTRDDGQVSWSDRKEGEFRREKVYNAQGTKKCSE